MFANANIISSRIRYNVEDFGKTFINKLLTDQVSSYSNKINSRIIVVNTDYLVKADSNVEFTGQILKHKEIQSAINGGSKVNLYNLKNVGRVMYISVPIILNNEVIGATLISTSLNDVYRRIREIRRVFNIVSIIGVLIISVFSFIYADIFTKPIRKFTKAVTEMAQGHLGEKVDIKTSDEFQKLATAFNIMSTKLDQVDVQRKDFVGNVSHELRTPLSSMKLLSSSLLHQNETDINIYREFLKDIDSETDRLNKIIDDLLMMVDLDKEKLKLNYKTIYINFWIEKIISRIKPLAEEKNIKLIFKSKKKIQIDIDEEKLQRAVVNIVHNAIKYTPIGGTVEISTYLEGKFTVIKICDNGIGIPEENIERIFERFYRVDKARDRNTGGTGLGLSIANQIVMLHQGTIKVESEIGKGTRFYLYVPSKSNVV